MVNDERLIASLTSIGLNGTLAIGLAKLAGVCHIDGAWHTISSMHTALCLAWEHAMYGHVHPCNASSWRQMT